MPKRDRGMRSRSAKRAKTMNNELVEALLEAHQAYTLALQSGDRASVSNAQNTMQKLMVETTQNNEPAVCWGALHNDMTIMKNVLTLHDPDETRKALLKRDSVGFACIDYAFVHCNFAMIEWVHEKGGAPVEYLMHSVEDEPNCAATAAREGRLDLLQWLETRGAITSDVLLHKSKGCLTCAEYAIKNQNRDMFQWVENRGGVTAELREEYKFELLEDEVQEPLDTQDNGQIAVCETLVRHAAQELEKCEEDKKQRLQQMEEAFALREAELKRQVEFLHATMMNQRRIIEELRKDAVETNAALMHLPPQAATPHTQNLLYGVGPSTDIPDIREDATALMNLKCFTV